MHRVATITLTLALIASWVTPAWPWGCEGHETVALIAEKHLTAGARRSVTELLARMPTEQPLERSCRPNGLGLMAAASTWADDVRNDDRSPYRGTAQWHFIDIPLRASGDLGAYCPRHRGCILSAIDEQLATLRAGGMDRGRMAVALLFVIHLIADLHQPLHCATNGDSGANCVPVAYFGIEPQLSPQPLANERYQPNLHAVWDRGIVRRILRQRTPAWFANELEQRFRTQMAEWQEGPVDLKQWAWESHQVAEQVAYGKLPVSLPVETREQADDCERVARRILRLHERLAHRYQDAAAPAVEMQLAKAGVRLAMVLNQLWP